MARHVAVEQPDTGIVRNHIGNRARHRCEHDHVGTHVTDYGGLTVPMAGVNIPGFFFVWICKDVPPNALSLMHGHHRTIPVEITIDGVKVMEVMNPNIASIVILGVTVESL